MATVDLQKQRTGKNLRLLHEVAAAVGEVNVAPEASQESPEVGSHLGGRNRPDLERVRDGCPIRVGQHGVGSGRAWEAVFVEAHDERVGPAGVATRPDRGDVQTAGTGGGAHHDERVGQPGEPFERLPRISAGMLRKPPLHVCQFGDEPVLRIVVELAPGRRNLLEKQSGPLHEPGCGSSLGRLALHEPREHLGEHPQRRQPAIAAPHRRLLVELLLLIRITAATHKRGERSSLHRHDRRTHLVGRMGEVEPDPQSPEFAEQSRLRDGPLCRLLHIDEVFAVIVKRFRGERIGRRCGGGRPLDSIPVEQPVAEHPHQPPLRMPLGPPGQPRCQRPCWP